MYADESCTRQRKEEGVGGEGTREEKRREEEKEEVDEKKEQLQMGIHAPRRQPTDVLVGITSSLLETSFCACAAFSNSSSTFGGITNDLPLSKL